MKQTVVKSQTSQSTLNAPIHVVLNRLYYDTSLPSSYGGVQSLMTGLKNVDGDLPPYSQKQVKEWLSRQWTYSLHKPARRRGFPQRKYVTRGLNFQFQSDLVEMIPFERENNGYRYIMTTIDIFSRYGWAIPIKRKTGPEIVKALSKVFRERKPRLLQTDQGLEFENKVVRAYLAKQGVELFSVKSPYKASICERFNRSIKTRMYRVFTHRGSHRWIDIIQSLVDSYNASFHRTIGMAPKDVTKENETKLWQRLYANATVPVEKRAKVKTKFKLGDRVRLSKYKRIFEKGFHPNWTEEQFVIHSINTKYKPVTYRVRSLSGEVIEGSFYSEELQRVHADKNEYFRISRVLRSRGRGANKQVLVSWKGYEHEPPTWIPYSEIVHVKDVKL